MLFLRLVNVGVLVSVSWRAQKDKGEPLNVDAVFFFPSEWDRFKPPVWVKIISPYSYTVNAGWWLRMEVEKPVEISKSTFL